MSGALHVRDPRKSCEVRLDPARPAARQFGDGCVDGRPVVETDFEQGRAGRGKGGG
jgi:hypothetical protein